MEHGDLGKEQFEVIVQLGHGANSGAGGFYRPTLIDGNGRGNTLDALHIRLVHPVQKLACVSREAFDITSLSFGVKNVEGQRGFSRTAYAGDDGKSVEGNLQIEVLEVVLLGAANFDPVLAH